MTRVKGGNVARKRHKKILKAAKGFFGSKHRLYKTAKEQLMHSYVYAYRDRKQNKRNFRKLWITRINAACRENNINYSKFINGLNKAGLAINRKMLSELAIQTPEAFTDLVSIANDALDGKKYEPKKIDLKKTDKKETKEKKESKPKAVATKKEETKTTAAKKTASTKKTTSTKSTTAKKATTKKSAATKKASTGTK